MLSFEKIQIIIGSITIVISLIGLTISIYKLFFYKQKQKNNPSFDSLNVSKTSKNIWYYFINNIAAFCFAFFCVLLLVGISIILGWIKLK